MTRRIDVDFHGYDMYVTGVAALDGDSKRNLLAELGEQGTAAYIDDALASDAWLLDWNKCDGSTAFLVGAGTPAEWVTWGFLADMAHPFSLIAPQPTLVVAEQPSSATASRNDLALAAGGAA